MKRPSARFGRNAREAQLQAMQIHVDAAKEIGNGPHKVLYPSTIARAWLYQYGPFACWSVGLQISLATLDLTTADLLDVPNREASDVVA